jgi:hydrogenase-1 operon protein HyaF
LYRVELTNARFLVLTEVTAALHKLLNERKASTIFLAQFPITDGDREFLSTFLGEGDTAIEIAGLSVTRFLETRYAGVWWGEYFDGSGKVSMQTIEVAETPELAGANREDINESLGKLMIRLPEVQCGR